MLLGIRIGMKESFRVLRGMSWGGEPSPLRGAYRSRDEDERREDDTGFRLVVRIKDE